MDEITTDLLQFGVRRTGLIYPVRPCVYGIAAGFDGRLAVARIGAEAPYEYDLPGGGIEPGETEGQALEREFREETGLGVRAGWAVARAAQYWVKPGISPRNAVSTFRICSLTGDAGGGVEADHHLVWLEPLAAALAMRHDAHAWAILFWMRSQHCHGRNA